MPRKAPKAVEPSSPYTSQSSSGHRAQYHTCAIPLSIMEKVDTWAAEHAEEHGRPFRSRNEAVNEIVRRTVEGK